MSSKPSQNLLSTYEAAKASGYSPAYISSLCRSGELPSTRNGKAWMIKRSDLKAYLSKVEDEKKRQAEELARKRKDEYWEVQRREQNLLSTYEAAKASGYSPAYISSLCRSGELPSTRNGKAWVIKADDLQVHLSKVEEEKKKLHEELAEKRKNEYREVQPVVTVTRKVFAQRFTYNPVHTYTRATAALLITFIVVSASTGVFTSKEESIADVREAQGSISEMNALSAAASNSSSPMVEVAKSIAYFTYATIDNFFADTERKVAAFFAPRTNVQVHVVDTPDPVSISSATTSAPLNSTTTIVQGTTTIQNITQNITRYITNATDNRTTVNGVSAEFLTYALSGFGEYLLRPVWLSFYALDERFANVYDRIDDIDVDGGGGTIGGDITGDSITISGNGSIGGSFSSGTTTVNGGITVNGDANITGELTVGTFNVATLNVTSTISAPSFNATSTTATSTFAGPLQFATATGNSLSVNTLFATSSTFANLLATNATTTNATSTNLFATLFRATTGTIDTFTSTLATITNAVVTTLSATNATLTNATTTNATSTNLSVSGIFRLSGITPSRLLFADSSGAATSTDLSTWVTGTANQISVADNGAGGVTLSLPSDLQLGNATATSFSSNSAAFGSTGTTTISTAGALTTPSLSIGSLNGILRATGGAIATSLVSLATDVEDVLPVSNGGTGTGTAPVFGQLLVGNGTGGYALMATSSLGITSAEWGNITGTLSDQTDLQNALDAKLSLSAWFATTTDALAEGTNLYYTDARVSTLLDTYSKDYFFSTTSANYWETQQTARTADDLTNNSIEDLSDVASMTPNVNDFLTWNGSAWTNVATSSFGFVTGVAWGDITGTLSDQTDLQNALNAKFSLSDWHATTTHTGITSLPSLTTLGTITSGVWQGSAIAPAYLDPMVLLTTEVDTSAELAGILSDEVGTGSVVFSNAPTFTGVSNFADIITTNATSTNFFVSGQARFGTLDGLLRADAGVISVATPGVDYLADATGDWTGTFDGYEGSYYLANSFSTSSANSWLATRSTDDLAEGSNLYYTDARVLSYVDSLGKGYFFSTTSANTWLGTKSTDDIAEGANLYYTLNRFASALAGTTTDALLEGSTNLYYTDARARAALSSSAAGLSYNSATGVLSLSAGYTIPLAASTTEWATAYSWGNHATQNYFDLDLNDSDDIPEGGTNLFYSNSRVATYLDTVSKGYFFSTTSANYWDTQQTARTADDLTNNSIEDLMDVAAMTKSWGNLLSWNGSAWTNVATSSLGLTPTFTATYPLQYSSNVLSLAFGTTTANTWGPLQTFNSGILAQASSTIVGDFTITGTTHLEEVSIAGDIIPTADNVYSLGTPSRMWRDVYIGPGSLYINGQKVLEEDATTDIVVTADPTQNLKIKTTDGGNIELNANATGQLIFKSNLNITGGKSIVTSDLSTLPVPNGIAAGNITVATNTISATNLNGGISLAGNGTGGVYVTSGNFGVGTTSPLAKLSVAGNTYLGGTLTATGTVTFSSLGDGFVKSTGGVLGIAVPGVDYLDDTSGDWTGTFDGQEGSYYLANSFSTTSANYWETQQTARTADDLTNNSIEDLSDVASMTKSFGNLLSWSGSAWNNIATSTLGIAFADITGTVSQNQGGTGMTSYSPGDILYADNAGALTPLPKGANGQVLKLSGGLPSWGSDITTGGGGGEGAWATTTDSLAIYTTDTSDAVIIGSSATTTANSIFEVFGTSYFSNTIGIATTSPSPLHKLAVQGNALFSGNITSANITATGTVTFSGLGSGLVKATSGVLSLATAGADYVADVTGDWTGTFDGQEGSYYLANSFSTTSAAYWKSQTDFFSTTSTNAWLATKSTSNLAEGTNLYYTNARVLTYLDTFDKGYFFSTTSAAYWKEQNNFFSTTSTNAWLATKSTSDLAEGTNLYWTTARFDNRLSATTTLPNLTTLANLATVGT
ncbi:MAG TPA: helix-turn-helix domain-containing protein, partial [Candidatus Paceibacterota bacterium]|nr:helix-turn-helix domain-containing protein [Candidatus Paceibacterota bacterium]